MTVQKKFLVYKIGTHGELIHCPDLGYGRESLEAERDRLRLILMNSNLSPKHDSKTVYVVLPAVVVEPD